MFALGLQQTLKGLRTGDQARTTIGSAVLLFVAYRAFRRRTNLIARYEVREGDELKLRLPEDRNIDRDEVAAAILTAMEQADLAPLDLDDDLLGAPTSEHEGQ